MTTKLCSHSLEYGEVSRILLEQHPAIIEAFKLQARLDGVVGGRSVTFGSVSVLKTFKKFFSKAEDAVLVAAFWSVVVASSKAGRPLTDMTPAEPNPAKA